MRVPYTKRTYEEIRDELIRQIPEYTNKWTDFNLSDPGILILDALAAVADMLNYSIDRNLAEFFIPTMTLRQSAVRLAATLGYKLRRPSPALVTVRFSVAEPWPNDITIGKWTEITGGNNVPFITLADTVLQAGSTYVDVPVVQAKRFTVTQISTGEPSQLIQLGSDDTVCGDFSTEILGLDLAFKATEVYVNGELWERVDSFIENPEKAYLEENRLETVYVVFGDGVFGAIPPAGAEVKVIYYETLGSEGNLPAEQIKGTITLQDVQGRIVGVQYAAVENAVGGEDKESLTEAKRNIPASLRYMQTLTNRESWIAAMEQFPGVLLANAWGEQQEDPPNFRMFNVVRVTFVPENPEWSLPSQAMIESVLAMLNKRKEITLMVEYVEPSFVEFDLRIRAWSLPTTSASLVENAIRAKVADMFRWGNYSFEAKIYHSDIVQLVESIPGVSHCFVEIKCPAKGINDYSVVNFQTGLAEIPKLSQLEVSVTSVST